MTDLKKCLLQVIYLCFCLFLAVCSTVKAEEQSEVIHQGKFMNDASQKAAELLNIPDERFYTITFAETDELAKRLSPFADAINTDLESFEPIFAIGAPKIFEAGDRATIPILLADRYSGLRAWEVQPISNTAWIVVDLTTGVVRTVGLPIGPIAPIGFDFKMAALPPSRTPPPPSSAGARAVTYNIALKSLPPVFGHDWPSERYAATMVYYDWLSNTVVLERKPKPQPQPPAPATPTPYVGIFTDSAQVRGGIQLSVSAAEQGPALLRAIISLPRQQVVLLTSARDERQSLLPLSLLFMKLDSTNPVQLDLMLPVTINNETVSTQFSFDFRNPSADLTLQGEYQVYAATGEIVSGPYALNMR
jgi:hypothetical protein